MEIGPTCIGVLELMLSSGARTHTHTLSASPVPGAREMRSRLNKSESALVMIPEHIIGIIIIRRVNKLVSLW